jgi:hypothetical protein
MSDKSWGRVRPPPRYYREEVKLVRGRIKIIYKLYEWRAGKGFIHNQSGGRTMTVAHVEMEPEMEKGGRVV